MVREVALMTPPSADSKNNREHHPANAWKVAVERLCGIVEGRSPVWWRILFGLCVLLSLGLGYALYSMTTAGIGVLGTDQTVMWGWDIINFVFWIGIGHAGTLISAILLLTRQQWRSSVSRIAEVMTICAVLCAAVFPVFHMGRVWMAWFFIPAPEANGMWQNFLSPLMWDAFAVGTYFLLSCLFLYVSMLPDLAMLRDRAGSLWKERFYGLLALGWRGTIRQWSSYRRIILIMAGILTPLVISVHSVVSYDFAITLNPGWHSSLFPPYFVAGAILGGLAMVLLVVIPLRALFHLEDFISINHLGSLAKLLLALSLAIGFAYTWETFMAFYSGESHEMELFSRRIHSWGFRGMVAFNVLAPQILWLRRMRKNTLVLLAVGLLVTLGMWLERFEIIVGSMEKSFIAASWSDYMPSGMDVLMFAGTFGLFFGGILLFIRFFPCVGVAELCELRGRQNLNSTGEGVPAPGRYETREEFLTASHSRQGEGEETEAVLPFAVEEVESPLVSPDSISRGAFMGGVAGFILSLALVLWTQLVDYPLILQGREAGWERLIGFFPVVFETVILGGGLGGLIQFARNSGLFQWHHPWFASAEYKVYRRSFAFYLWKK